MARVLPAFILTDRATLKFPKRRKEITFWRESVGTPGFSGMDLVGNWLFGDFDVQKIQTKDATLRRFEAQGVATTSARVFAQRSSCEYYLVE